MCIKEIDVKKWTIKSDIYIRMKISLINKIIKTSKKFCSMIYEVCVSIEIRVNGGVILKWI